MRVVAAALFLSLLLSEQALGFVGPQTTSRRRSTQEGARYSVAAPATAPVAVAASSAKPLLPWIYRATAAAVLAPLGDKVAVFGGAGGRVGGLLAALSAAAAGSQPPPQVASCNAILRCAVALRLLLDFQPMASADLREVGAALDSVREQRRSLLANAATPQPRTPRLS